MSQPKTTRRHRVRRMSERRRLTVTAITAMLALVTVVICALSGVFNFHKGSERILPNLVGQTEESAKAQLAELDGTQKLLDLYCGIGSIGLSMAHLCSELVGVEVVPQAVADADACAHTELRL